MFECRTASGGRRRGRLVAALWLGASSALAGACGREGARAESVVCSDASSLGTVGRKGEPISGLEVRALVARVGMAGGRLTEREALIDLLWQESERRRLGLAGGSDASWSRRTLVQGHQDRLRRRQAGLLRADPTALPPGTRLTACGRKLLGR